MQTFFSRVVVVGALLVLNACNPGKPTPDYSLAFNPATLNMAAGATANATIAITPIGGFDLTQQKLTALVVEGSAYGTSDSQIQVGEPVAVDDTHASFTFTSGSGIGAGSYDLNFKATIGGLQRSAKITIKIGAGTSTVPNPTGLTATVVSSSQIDLNWNAVTGATKYLIEQKVGSSFQALGTVDTPGAQVTSLSPSSNYTFRVKTQIGTNTSSGVETSATTQSGNPTQTTGKYGFVTITEIELPGGLGTNRTASALFYSAKTAEPPTVGGFGVARDTCLAMTAGQTEPAQPASVKLLDAGTELSLKSGLNAYVTLLKTSLAGRIFYGNNPTTPLTTVPNDLNISIPGNPGGFPAFSNVSLPTFPPDFSITAPGSADPLALDGTITWDGGLDANNTMGIFIGSSVKDAPGAFCFANDDGSFTVPANVKSVFETAGLTSAKLVFMTRSQNRTETTSEATLILGVSRSKFAGL
jgi:hypothetical protein